MKSTLNSCPICGREFVRNGLKLHLWRAHSNNVNPGSCPSHTKCALEIELDDDGKLYTHYSDKASGDRARDIECDLTIEQYCQLMKDAGIKSSQLGFNSSDKYVLARYNDEGPYSYGNCRFLRQRDNIAEQKRVVQARKRKDIIERWKNIEEDSCTSIDGFKSCNEQLESEGLLDFKHYVGKYNSQYGTFWITNDSFNAKWRIEKGELPNGFRKGRIMGLPSIKFE